MEFTVFTILGIAGLVILLASLALGDVLDSLDFLDVLDFGCSSAALGAVLAVFGLVGEIVRQTHLPLVAVWVIAIGLSLAVGYVVQRVINHLEKAETGVANYSIVGMQGEVTVRVTDSSGEVKLDDHRELESRLARAAHYRESSNKDGNPTPLNLEIPKGTKVVVLEQKGVHAIVEPVATIFE